VVPEPADGVRIDIRPLTPDRWQDFEAIFNARGCSVARGCWCMYYRRSGTQAFATNRARVKNNKAGFRAIVKAGGTPGLIAYRDGVPVGWVAVGPREDFAKLARSPVLRPVDEAKVWSIICFVVPAEFRGQGVARALLRGAIAHARRQGARLVEAYPVDRQGRSADDSMWFGAKSMFDAAGFTEVARRKPQRPIVRRRIRRSATVVSRA
jgi:ribosomal protein S18 acetylase RimI-like enzyme